MFANPSFVPVDCSLRGLYFSLILLAVVLAIPGLPLAAEDPGLSPVGVAQIDITPSYPVRMYGYAARRTESEGVAGRLQAAALVLGDDAGEGPAVLLTVDSGVVPPEIRDEVLRRVREQIPLQTARFVLANSHTHAGPNLRGRRQFEGSERERIERYAGELTDKLEQVVLAAAAARQPGRLSWTQGTVGFAANRRVLRDGRWSGFGAVPDGAVDHRLPLLRVTDAQHELLALVVNYACHNTTLRGNFVQIHGDWTGSAIRAIQADHPGVIPLVTIGCGADADPHPHGTVELCDQHGRALADEVNRLLAGPFQPLDPQLSSHHAVLEIVYQPELPTAESTSDRPVTHSPSELEVTVWAFGEDLALIFLPHEVVVDYALRIQCEFDGSRLWISAYCHDVATYLVSPRLIEEGGYEVRSSLSYRLSGGEPERVTPPIKQQLVEHVGRLLPAAFHSQ